MIVAVTGGAGFIGRHVVHQLIHGGHECRVIDIAPAAEGVAHVRCDITDVYRLVDAIAGADAVIHLAAVADFADVEADPARAEDVNAGGTIAVLRAAQASGVRRFVYGSTFWVYDGLTGKADENTPLLAPQHLYTASKLAGEQHCRRVDTWTMDVMICRLGTAYGPGARPALMTSRMLSSAAAGEPLTINGDGTQGRQLTYVGDLADGLVRALSDGVPGSTYNLVGPRVVSVREVADEVRSLLGDVDIVHMPARVDEVRMPLVSADRAARELRWRAVTALPDGLARQLTAQLIARRSNEQVTSPGLVGVFDAPSIGTTVARGPVVVSGWAIGIDCPVSSIHVSIAGGRPIRAGLHRLRPNLAVLGADGSAFAGFEIRFDLRDVVAADAIRVDATVELLDGTRGTLQSLTIAVGPAPPMSALHPPQRRRWARVGRRRPNPIRLLIWARALGGGGSQFRMCELAEALAADGGFRTTIASPLEGPLRPVLERAGATVEVVPRIRLHAEDSYRTQVDEAVRWARDRFDLVFAPTITSFPGLEIAARLDLPSVWRIGEVEPLPTVAGWLGDRIHPWIEQRAAQAYGVANRVVFNCQQGLDVRREAGFEGRFRVLGTGVDIEASRSYRDQFGRNDCRRTLGLPESVRLILCTATLWPIKAQATLVSAFKPVHANHPNLHLAIVGENRQPYTAALVALVEQLGLDEAVAVVAPTRDVRPWLRAADALVLASETESMPTSALEAMAFQLPVFSTRVGGVPEIVADGETGWLCEPCDVRSIADGLERLATTSDAELGSLGERAAVLVARKHDRQAALASMTRLLRDVSGQRAQATW